MNHLHHHNQGPPLTVALLWLFTLWLLFACVCSLKTANHHILNGGAGSDAPYATYVQKVDHFSTSDTRTFNQRYFVNNNYYDGKDGPVVVYISGEGPAGTPSGGEEGLLAQRYNASLITLEHRYYGQSTPFTTTTTANLAYLTTKQALADYAVFINYYVTSVLPPVKQGKRKVITIGGSYAGALSAWFRLVYPNVTCASVSSSGVVNAILDFTAFDQQVAESVGSACADALRQVTDGVEKLIAQGGSAATQLKTLYKASTLVDNGDFFYFLADSMAEGVQYGYQDSLCNPLLQAIKNNQSLVDVYAEYLSSTWTSKLGNNAADYATAYQQTTTVSRGDRLWWFQTCNELAYFQNAPSQGSIRSRFVNMTYHRTHCEQLFGSAIWPDTVAVNNYYGGDKIAATNVYFANGSQDPWKRASVVSALSSNEPASVVTCHNCAHCVDLRGCPGSCTDPTVVDVTRKDIFQFMDKWLSQC